MGTGTGGYVWGRGDGKAPTWQKSIPALLLLPTLKWSGAEALSSGFPRPPEASGSAWALAGILFWGQLGPSIPEHRRSQGMAGLDPCLPVTWQGVDDR